MINSVLKQRKTEKENKREKRNKKKESCKNVKGKRKIL